MNKSGRWICIHFLRIWIQLFFSMRIRIQLLSQCGSGSSFKKTNCKNYRYRYLFKEFDVVGKNVERENESGSMRIRIHSSEIIRRVGIHYKGRKRKRRHPTCRPWQLWRPDTAQGSPPSACLSHPAHPHQQLTLGIKNHIYRYLHKVKTWPKKNCLRQICEQLIKKT